jgi:hypothetical protein
VTKDTLTGIRIGNTTYQEGRHYRGFQFPQFLLDRQPYRGARVMFDITGKQLTITVANRQGTLVGQFAVRGRALASEDRAGIAEDFAVKRVVEASQTLRTSGSTLRRGVAVAQQRFRFNTAYRQWKRSPGPLPRQTWQALALSTQSSSRVITFRTRELKPELGPFAATFAGEWWAPVV